MKILPVLIFGPLVKTTRKIFETCEFHYLRKSVVKTAFNESIMASKFTQFSTRLYSEHVDFLFSWKEDDVLTQLLRYGHLHVFFA